MKAKSKMMEKYIPINMKKKKVRQGLISGKIDF